MLKKEIENFSARDLDRGKWKNEIFKILGHKALFKNEQILFSVQFGIGILDADIFRAYERYAGATEFNKYVV